MPLMSLFLGVSMCRQSIAMILFYLKSVVSCLIHSNNCSLHGSSGPRRKQKSNVKPDAMGEIISLHILQPGSARYYSQGNQVSTLFVGIGIPCTCLNAL